MISVYKLEKLPRSQRLRKIAKIFILAENLLCKSAQANKTAEPGVFSVSDFIFFTDVSKLLATDIMFPDNAKKAFEEAAAVFETSAQSTVLSPARIRRALNTVKHLLLTATDRNQADWDFTAEDGKLDPARRKVFEGMFVYMEDIRSPFNVGAMFRTAEIFGVEKIFLSQFCADPRHRRAERTAMGCVDVVPWERREFFTAEKNPVSPTPVFALETRGVPIDKFPFPRQGLLIAGSEELGVSPRALAAADASLGRVSIPVYGAKASLNVSVAFGIALQAWAQSLV